ncbi:hypothetical protein [Gloeothece verrucosa]|uniref:Uncharacterized protein n=1 Tax=Gloeothece verrucosa (strain PCC 7822) TaxID=497965 RepID=E0UB86_GLOV7|nr:hypothetical protein [Gloeothece verrucosa]ADN16331.1 conserved hypothetical protein [Gloeothece verrucosa PCC 7822]
MNTQLINKASRHSEPITCKTEQILKDIRKTPIFCQLIPQEAGIGYPIPLRKEGKVYIILPFFGIAQAPEKETKIFPPFATITLNWFNQVPVEYVNLRFRNPAPELNWEEEVGTFPHPAIQPLTIEQYKEHRRELFAMYDEMFDNLAQGTSFSPDWCELFSQQLRLLIEPSLVPYYRALGQKFFDKFNI